MRLRFGSSGGMVGRGDNILFSLSFCAQGVTGFASSKQQRFPRRSHHSCEVRGRGVSSTFLYLLFRLRNHVRDTLETSCGCRMRTTTEPTFAFAPRMHSCRAPCTESPCRATYSRSTLLSDRSEVPDRSGYTSDPSFPSDVRTTAVASAMSRMSTTEIPTSPSGIG